MLSRTADSLYWLARYVERAENISRAVLVGHWMASMARSLGNPGNEWESTLIASGCAPGFRAKYTEITPTNVVDYLVRDPEVVGEGEGEEGESEAAAEGDAAEASDGE